MNELADTSLMTSDTSEVPRYFSLSQRIGRLRYLVYTLSGMIVCSATLLLVYLFCLTLPPALAKLVFDVCLVVIKNILMPMIVFVMTIRRLHDVNFNGWWSLAVVIPFVTAILLLVPGSEGSNRFGPQPRTNGVAVKLAAIGLPLALTFLFLALKDVPSGRYPQGQTGEGLQTYPQ